MMCKKAKKEINSWKYMIMIAAYVSRCYYQAPIPLKHISTELMFLLALNNLFVLHYLNRKVNFPSLIYKVLQCSLLSFHGGSHSSQWCAIAE